MYFMPETFVLILHLVTSISQWQFRHYITSSTTTMIVHQQQISWNKIESPFFSFEHTSRKTFCCCCCWGQPFSGSIFAGELWVSWVAVWYWTWTMGVELIFLTLLLSGVGGLSVHVCVGEITIDISVTRKKSPKVYKSCPKMISL